MQPRKTRFILLAVTLFILSISFIALERIGWDKVVLTIREEPVNETGIESDFPSKKADIYSLNIVSANKINPSGDFANMQDMKYPVIESSEGSKINAYAGTHVIVRMKGDLQEVSGIDEILEANGYQLRERLYGKTFVVGWSSEFPEVDFASRYDYLAQLEQIENIERDYLVYALSESSTSLPDWGYDLNLDYLRTNEVRADGILIALIDTGINSLHEDLDGVMFRNPSEVSDGRDSDGNGYSDDLWGYDFVDLDNSPIDEDGHGTALAGAICATRGNDKGIDGIATGAKLLNVRILDDSGLGFISDAIKGVDYSRTLGADIINCSWGNTESSEELLQAMERFASTGGIIVTAAGNETYHLYDNSQVYPACYDVDGLLSIGSYSMEGYLSSFSNWGPEKVDWLLPGEDLYLPGLENDAYQSVSGTSCSAAIMSGIVALAKASAPTKDRQALFDNLIQSTDPHYDFFQRKQKVKYYGKLNIRRFLENDLLSEPDLQFSVTPDSYLYGDEVYISLAGLNGHMGTYYWYLNSPDNVLEEEVDQITVTPLPSTETWDIYFRFKSYYADIDFGPISLSPEALDLFYTSEFKSSYTLLTGESIEISPALEGSLPITINWYNEGGELISSQWNYSIEGFNFTKSQKIYYIAENSVSSITSPLIDIKSADFVFQSFDLQDAGIGNIILGDQTSIALSRSLSWVTSDFVNWQMVQGKTAAVEISAAAYYKGKFIGISNSGLISSKYGYFWDEISSSSVPNIHESDLEDISVIGDYLVLSDFYHDTNWATTDLISWELLETALLYAGGIYYKKDNGVLVCSENMIDWSPTIIATATPNRYLKLGYANGLYLFSDNTNSYYSYNGKQWTLIGDITYEVENLFFHNGRYYFGKSGLSTFTTPDNITNTYFHFYGERFIRQLNDGRILSKYQNQILISRSDDIYQRETPQWIPLSSTNLNLGESFRFKLSTPQEDVSSIKLYQGGTLAEERTSYPFYNDLFLDGIGDYDLLAEITLNDGTVLHTDFLPVQVNPAREQIIVPYSWNTDLTIVGNGWDLGCVFMTPVGNSKTVGWIEDLWKWDNIVEVDSPVLYYPRPDYYFYRTSSGEVLSLIKYRGTGYGYERKLYYFDINEDPLLISYFLSENYYTEEEFWEPDLIEKSNFGQDGTKEVAIFDGEKFVLEFTYNNSDGFLYKSSSNEWLTYEPIPNSLYKIFRSELYEDNAPEITNVSSGEVWQVPRDFQFIYPFEKVVHGRSSYSQYTIVDKSGRSTPFEFGDDYSVLDYIDGDGLFYIGMDYVDKHLDLMPLNEIVLKRSEDAIEIKTTASGLELSIPVLIRQLSIGANVLHDLTFDVFLTKDADQVADETTHLGEFVLNDWNLDRGIWDQVIVSIPIPTDIDTGTYAVGIKANMDEKDFPETTPDNEIWYEWTRELQSMVIISENPDLGTIEFNPPHENLMIGDEVSFSFTPNPGLVFSGWSDGLDGIDNPAIRTLPGYVNVEAGAIHAPLMNLFPDTRFSGYPMWHKSQLFGEFEATHYPWLNHDNLGWVLIGESQEQNRGYLYDDKLGWIYLNREIFPYAYQVSEQRWIFYTSLAKPGAAFYDLNCGNWILTGI